MAQRWWKASSIFSKRCAVWQQVPAAEQADVESPTVAHPLLALLYAAPHSSEALAHAAGWPLPEVLAALTELELDGRVACEAGLWVGRKP